MRSVSAGDIGRCAIPSDNFTGFVAERFDLEQEPKTIRKIEPRERWDCVDDRQVRLVM
jgi:hypothetical protein